MTTISAGNRAPHLSEFAGGNVPVKQLDIVVLSGGPSAEREVSLDSGKAVFEALVRLGHRPQLRDISPNDLSAIDGAMDFVFIALHGEFGEDGTVQAELDKRGIPFAGSGADSSRIAMNKVDSKRRFIENDIDTPAFEHVRKAEVTTVCDTFGLPAVVKPVASGSSVDTFIVRDRETLTAALGRLVDKYGEALVESLIEGPELTCAVLGNEALPICEIRPAREFYDYIAKYKDDDTQYLFDSGIPEALQQRVKTMSLAAHASLGCSVFSRVDIMVDKATEKPYILEINTIPGFTSHSLVPKAASRIGIGFDQLCQFIIEASLRKTGSQEVV